MAVTLAVPAGVLARARAAWDDAADGLDGGWRRLVKAATAGVSSTVVPAVEAFQQTWVDELKRRAVEAQDNSEAFVEVGGVYQFVDVASAERARALLGWVHRDVPLEVR